MAKALFRWLRGELNGYYITNIHNTLNAYIKEITTFLGNFYQKQFNTTDMDSDTIYNIGKFAGVFLPRLSTGETYGALKMTSSEKVNSVERSERGLLRRDTEQFDFVHTEQDDYPEDINTLATKDKKSSLVSATAVTQGYISSEENVVLDSEGNVIGSAVTLNPPANVAYSNYYGNNYLYLSEATETRQNIEVNLYYDLYKIMQWIRYNGVNIVSFCKMVKVICPDGLVTIDKIVKYNSGACFIVTYTYDSNSSIMLKDQRLATLLYVVSLKFPQFIMQESI